MENIEFKTLEELYNFIKPALYSKVEEYRKNKISYIKEEDIWNYLTISKWKKSDTLTISDMVSDIMDLKLDDVKMYVLECVRKRNTDIIKEDLL